MNTASLIALAALSAAAYCIFPTLNLAYYAWLPAGRPLMFLSWAWLTGFIYERERARPMSAVWLMVVPLVLCTVNNTYQDRFSTFTMLAVLLTLIAGGRVALPNLGRKFCSFLGDYSYPFYLFHVPAMIVSPAFHLHKTWVLVVAAFAISLLALLLDNAMRPTLKLAWFACAARLESGTVAVRLAVGHFGRLIVATPFMQSLTGPLQILERGEMREAA